MTLTRTLLVAAAFTLAALCLAACASDPANPAIHAANPGELYPLRAVDASDRIALAVHADGLSPAQAEAIKALAGRRREAEGGDITVSQPHGAADSSLALKAASAAEAVLVLEGAPIRRSSYESDDPKAPILVSFTALKAQVPVCGKHWDQLTHTEDNRVQPNFGCALTANMAAQIANPSDIARPQAEQPGDTPRRMTVLGNYQSGKTTAGDDKGDGAGLVSKVGR